jgi:hypothetical protein
MAKVGGRRLLGALAAASALALAGCGVSRGGASTVVAGPSVPDGGATPAYLSGAAASTGEYSTGKMTVAVEIAGVPGFAGTMTVDGQFDRTNHRASAGLDAGDPIPGMSGQAMRTVVDGTDVYLSGPMLSVLGVDKEWAKVDLGAFGELGKMGDPTGGIDPDGPRSFLDLLGSVGKVDTVGAEDVRGVPTTHYRTTVDVAALSERAPGKVRDRLDQLLATYGASLDDLPSVPIDAWVDGDGLVRRVRIVVDTASMGEKAGPAAGVTVTETVELYDLGQPVDIAVPDPADVGTLDLSKLGGH